MTEIPSKDAPPVSENPKDEVILSSHDLFGTANEVVIVHQGLRYRLRITRQGKLILNK